MHGSSRRSRGIARVALLGLLAASVTIMIHAAAFAAVNCDSVFEGVTPSDPIVKTADKTEAYAGQTVTFTLTFKSTGTSDNVTADCYRVGDGSNDALNALVTGFNEEKTTANQGDMGTEQHVTYEITIPDDPSLVGHDIVDRAKATSGSVESRSDLVTVHVIPAPCTENCSTPTPTPTPTPTSTVSATVTPKTSVKGVTLGKTGSSSGLALALGLYALAFGALFTGISIRRSKPEL